MLFEFDDDEIEVTVEFMGDEEESSIDIPNGVSLQDTTVFWFSREMPEEGQVVEYTSFVSDAMTEDEMFAEQKLRYDGLVEIEWNGELVEAHQMTDMIDEGVFWVDDQGHPYLAEFTQENEEGDESEFRLIRN